MSFVFYAWWDWRFIFLLAGTGTIDYICALAIVKKKSVVPKKGFLVLSVLSNILSLLFFKYCNWLITLFETILTTFDIHLKIAIPEFSIVLPLGISFYTFNAISYTVDIYRGKAMPAKNWLHFMAFISFFPHLVAGPIIRARDVLTQLGKNTHISTLSIYSGIRTCIWGFFQKMVLADNLAVYVNNAFDSAPGDQSWFAWWFCMLAFSFQIYFDFNGYSTIARGLAKLCGIHFRLNFNHPYLSDSFGTFWKRWHISLSSFFRDYVYIPLGGNRKGIYRAEVNRWITMLLSGLWHGANLTFILWGAVHAFFLSLEGLIQRKMPALQLLNRFSKMIVFTGVLLAWVLFRSPDVNYAFNVFLRMFSINQETGFNNVFMNNAFIWLALSLCLELPIIKHLFKQIKNNRKLILVLNVIMITMVVFFRGPEQDFIYFQF